MSTYQFDGQVVRTQDGEYVCEVIAFEPELMGKLLEHPFAKRLREAGPQIAAEVDRMMAATPSEDESGREVPEAVAWRNMVWGTVTANPVTVMDWDDEDEEVESLMTVAQHSRIVATLEAEIAEWELRCQYNADTAHDVAVERDELRAALLKVSKDGDKLRADLNAQPARQVGGDEPCGNPEIHAEWIDSDWPCPLCSAIEDKAALAPAAAVCVLPTVDQVMKAVMRYQWDEKKNVTGTTNWAANLGMAVVAEVARLNRNPIPVELLERIDRALEHARLFIRNGVELGFIDMPDDDTPDPAKETLPTVEAAQRELRALLARQQEAAQ